MLIQLLELPQEARSVPWKTRRQHGEVESYTIEGQTVLTSGGVPIHPTVLNIGGRRVMWDQSGKVQDLGRTR